MQNSDVLVAEWIHKSRRWSLTNREPTTTCYADLCRYAEGCLRRTLRPRRIAQVRYPGYWPEDLRPPATLSRLVNGLLNQYRILGQKQKMVWSGQQGLR